MSLRSGKVEYRERAFEQDATEAIRGDIVRALIELITNADDAYGADPGPIVVEVSRTGDEAFPIRVRVQDHAKGLDADRMIEAFAVLGGEKAADEIAARGLFGRGAKDVAALGRVVFKAIKDGRYSALELDSRGNWRMLAENEAATEAQRLDLGLAPDESGITVDLDLRPNVSVPSRLTLQDRVAGHAQLRGLVGRRPVLLRDAREKAPALAQLQAPQELGDVIVDEELPIDGYDPVHLVVRRLPQRGSGGVGPYSSHGLLIQSGVSTFENTWLDLEGRPEAAFLAGRLDAPQIAAIIRAYDRGDADLGGPTRLLSRNRDGLIKDHPYRRALASAVTLRLKPVFDELAKGMDADRHQGEELSKAFDVAREALRSHVRELLEEIDEEDQGEGDDVIAPLAIIPPRRVASPGEAMTFTVRALKQPMDALRVTIEQELGKDVVTASAAEEVDWSPHSRLDAVQANVFAAAGAAEGTAVLRVEVDGLIARATIIVREPSDSAVEPPSGLEIDPPVGRVAPGRRKRFTLRAPIELEGAHVAASSSPIVDCPPYVTLKAEPSGRWAAAALPVQASEERGSAEVHAWIGEHRASAQLLVQDAVLDGGLGLDFELSGHKSPNRRTEIVNEDGTVHITVYAMHPSFAGVFGTYVEDSAKFTDEDSPQARAVLAEVIASELGAFFTELEYGRYPERLDDAPRVLRRRAEVATRVLAPLHRSLRPSP